MSIEKEYSIDLTLDDVRQKLELVFREEHRETMTQCILDVLKDKPKALENIFKASVNILPQINYSEGDEVICSTVPLNTWSWDKDKMLEQGLVQEKRSSYMNEETVVGHIIKIDKWAPECYEFQHKFIDSDNSDAVQTYTSKVASKYIKGLAEEFPGDE